MRISFTLASLAHFQGKYFLIMKNVLFDKTNHSCRNSLNFYEDEVPLEDSALDCLHLVLDVVDGCRVTLARKENGRRSQLWRMTPSGMLQHEGSSPPFDPTSKKPRNDSNTLVLDRVILDMGNLIYYICILRYSTSQDLHPCLPNTHL